MTAGSDPADPDPTRGPSGQNRLRISAGDRLAICIPGGEVELRARVIEARAEGLDVLVGSDPRNRGLLGPGAEVRVLFGRGDRAVRLPAVIQDQSAPARVTLRWSEGPEEPVQRREYFRLSIQLPLAVRFPALPAGSGSRLSTGSVSPSGPPNPSIAPEKENAELRLFRLADLSGGGCRCLDPDRRLARGAVYQGSICLIDDGPPVTVRLQVTRRGLDAREPCAGIRFVDLPESSRERIMRFLFREQQNRARARG